MSEAASTDVPMVCVFDCELGEQVTRPMDADELAQRDADLAERAAARKRPPPPEPPLVARLRAGTASPADVQAALADLLANPAPTPSARPAV